MFIESIKKREVDAINACDIILPNSLILQNVLHKMYPEYTSKIYNYIDYTYFTVKNNFNLTFGL